MAEISIIFLIIFLKTLLCSHVKFVSIECCKSTNKSLLLEECEVKGNGVHVAGNIIRPLRQAFVVYELFYFQNGKPKRSMFKSKPFEWCSFTNGTKLNPLVKAFTDVYSKSIKPLMKKCPLFGKINITVQYEEKNNFVAMLPAGNYQLGEKVFNDEDINIIDISFRVKVY